MEQFNSKLYEKYQILKKRKLIQEEDVIHDRDAKIKSFQKEVDDFIDDLKSENDRLRSEIEGLQEKHNESQKLLLEETQKSKALSNEVGKLLNLLSKKSDLGDWESPESPNTNPGVITRSRSKVSTKKTQKLCTVENNVPHIEATSIPCESHHKEQRVPDCCRSSSTSSGDAMSEEQITCAFQTLMELLVSLKFSLQLKDEGICILAVHQRSGYTFSLTWIGHEDGRNGELWYRVFTLGTLERIALDWMKDDMVFSMSMFSVFFERIRRVLGRS